MCMYDDGDAPSFYSKVQRTARKAHKCDECGREIARGEAYAHVSAKWDGYLGTVKTCSHCAVLQDWLEKECGGYVHHAIVDDVREHLDEAGVPAYGYGLARLVVLARKGWRRKGQLTPIPPVPRTSHDAQPEPPQ